MSTSLPLRAPLLLTGCLLLEPACSLLPHGSNDHWEVSGGLQKHHLWNFLGTDTLEKP